MRQQLTQLAQTTSSIAVSYKSDAPVSIIKDFSQLIDETLVINEFALAEMEGDSEYLPLAYESVSESTIAVKNLSLLARDIIVERLRAKLLMIDGHISHEQLDGLVSTGREILCKASEETHQVITDSVATYENDEYRKKVVAKSQIILPPHQVLIDQLTILRKQFGELSVQEPKAIEVSQAMTSIRDLLLDRLDIENQQFDQLSEHLDNAIEVINSSEGDGLNIKTDIEDIVSGIDYMASHDELWEEISNRIDQLPTINMIVGTEQAKAVTRTVNLKTAMKNWMDVQYVPQVSELVDSSQQLHSRVSMALHNIKNRMSVDDFSLTSESLDDIRHVLSGLKGDLEKVQTLVSNNREMLSQRIKEEVRFSKLYENKEFLRLDLQGSISQVIYSQNERVRTATSWIKDKWKELQLSAQAWRTPQMLSHREAIAQCLKVRQVNATTEIYDQVFQTNTFISDVFLVNRDRELAQVDGAIDHWHSGVGTIIALTGVALSGKTTLLNQIANTRFSQSTIALYPNSEIKYDGTLIQSDYDIRAVLEQVLKIAKRRKTVILIDDLELWQNHNHSMLKNVNELLAFMAKHGDQLLVIMSLGKRLYDRLNTYIQLEERLYSTIDLSKCRLNEAVKTITVRHAATHKTLIDNQLQPLPQSKILDTIRHIHADAQGNIGDVLRRWTYGTQEISNNEVTFNYQNEPLPRISPNERKIFDTILLHKKITYSELISKYGRVVYERLRPTISQLTSDKLLLVDGREHLYINLAIINDVEYQLINQYKAISNRKKTYTL